MTRLNIFSCNLKGLNSPNKRACCFDILARNKADLVMIRETHLLTKDIYRLENHLYKPVAFSSATNKTEGVVILIHKKHRITTLGHGEGL